MNTLEYSVINSLDDSQSSKCQFINWLALWMPMNQYIGTKVPRYQFIGSLDISLHYILIVIKILRLHLDVAVELPHQHIVQRE